MSGGRAKSAAPAPLAPVLKGWTVPSVKQEQLIRKYSTTGDILSFRRCRRQYGYFGVRGFASATAVQRFFGTLVHDVLDRVHRDYRLSVLAGNTSPAMPTEDEVEKLVDDASERLIRSGVRPFNPTQQKKTATKLVYRFVRLVGPHFFPHVQETEYRLERALQTHVGRDYVLGGVVDILSGAVSHALGLMISTRDDDIEIWDYKSGRMPKKGSAELRDYEFQMRVYAELFKQQKGFYPARCVLAFVGELGDDRVWDEKRMDVLRFPRLTYVIPPDLNRIDEALKDFHVTVEEIEAERLKAYGAQWEAPAPEHRPDDETCEACDLRFRCDAYAQGAALRKQPL